MKVLFSNPPWWGQYVGSKYQGGIRSGSRWPFVQSLHSIPDRFRFGDYLPYPFFLGHAASYCAKYTDSQVTMRDSIAYRESYTSYYKYLENECPDFLFIETATPSWEHDSALIRAIKSFLPNTKIVVCGTICATKAEEVLNTTPTYAAVQGEFERGSVRVVNGESGVIPFDFIQQTEFNSIPNPYMDKSIAGRYCDANPRGQLFPQAQVWSSRGCFWKCLFCSFPANMTNNDPDGTKARTMRFHSPEYMEEFLCKWKKDYNFRCVYFDDDTFNVGDKHVLGMCKAMRKVNLPWSAMCRADTVKRETWKEMKDSGCFGVKIGFESLSQEVVDNIVHKNLNIKEAIETAKYLQSIGMTVHGTFMVGLPGETPEQRQMTLNGIKGLGLDSFQLSGAASIEGTPMDTLEKVGHLDKYPGAKTDENYFKESDGNKKMAIIAKELSG